MFSLLKKHKVYLVYIPLALYWVILFTLTTIPTDSIPKVGGSDKIKHFGAFFILSVLLNLTLKVQNKYRLLFNKAALFTVLIVAIYGMIDEIHQIFIPGRFGEFYDWLADFIGAVTGVFLTNKFIIKKD